MKAIISEKMLKLILLRDYYFSGNGTIYTDPDYDINMDKVVDRIDELEREFLKPYVC